MKKTAVSLGELAEKVAGLEAKQERLIEALKLLLPIALAIPATTSNSAEAVKVLQQALAQAEKTAPRSQDFWYLASAMALALSSRAVDQHPNDNEVVAIFQGLRAHKMQ